MIAAFLMGLGVGMVLGAAALYGFFRFVMSQVSR